MSSDAREEAWPDRDAWKPEPGNYFFMPGTWVRDTRNFGPDRGVIRDITEMHEGGTVVLYWFPNSSQYVSARGFRHMLREGEIEIDDRQHPYDAVGWSVND